VVLVEPEIPPNTGNIARICAATGSKLHLVGRLGFSVDEKAVRRAGLDYWHLVEMTLHPDLDTCLTRIGCPSPLLFTSNTTQSYVEAPYEPGQALVFGSETKGLGRKIIAAHGNRAFAIPTLSRSVRSLNLSNAVSVIVYEALKSLGAFDRPEIEP
jgi:tRNA (cytidine/uridine-2'-O-)-methyltransferase